LLDVIPDAEGSLWHLYVDAEAGVIKTDPPNALNGRPLLEKRNTFRVRRAGTDFSNPWKTDF